MRIKKERVQNKAMVRYGVKGIIELNLEDQIVHQKSRTGERKWRRGDIPVRGTDDRT